MGWNLRPTTKILFISVLFSETDRRIKKLVPSRDFTNSAPGLKRERLRLFSESFPLLGRYAASRFFILPE